MKRKLLLPGLMLLAVSVAVPNLVFANEGRCPMGGKGGQGDSAFSHTAKTVLKSQEKLGLSKEQIQSIRDLKLNVSKSLTSQNAEIKNVQADIFAQMHNDKVDLAAVQKMIDQKYELKKAAEKTSVEAIVKLKSLLTEQQLESLKKIKQEYKGHKGHSFWKKGKHGSESKETAQAE